MIQTKTRTATRRLVAVGVLTLGLCLCGLAAAATSQPPECSQQDTMVTNALALAARDQWQEAATLASKVQLMPRCWFPYLQAQALIGRSLGFHLDRQDQAIASYRRALGVDGRQSQLWYELGYLHYRQSHYEEAMSAFENALVHMPTNPPADPERFVMLCRLLHAESADRLASRSLGRYPEQVARAVNSWHDFQDYCADYSHCGQQDLTMAKQRLQVLAKSRTH